jgi:hypothetical protein
MIAPPKPILGLAVGLLTLSPVTAAFILPEFPPGAQTEFAWWDGFDTPYTDLPPLEVGNFVAPPTATGNTVNRPEADNTDAHLYQTATPSAFITSTQGIYSFAAPTSYLIYDQPAFETDSVLLQTRSLGALPDLESAAVFYRESASGPLLAAQQARSGEGFLLDGGNAYALWEWDLSSATIYDLFITFDATGTAMSLQEVQLDTFDAVTNNLGVALQITSNANFATVGEIEHALVGESEPRATYRPGDFIELSPVMDPVFEHVFIGWGGDLSGDAVPATLTIDANPAVSAIFAPRSYDGWRFNNINPFIASPSFSQRSAPKADPDGDGLPNRLEYALGTAPGAFTPPAERPRIEVTGTGEVHFIHRRQMAAEDLEYQIWLSDDLINWHHNDDGSGRSVTETVGAATPNGDGTETVTVRAASGFNESSKLFFRLRVLSTQP